MPTKPEPRAWTERDLEYLRKVWKRSNEGCHKGGEPLTCEEVAERLKSHGVIVTADDVVRKVTDIGKQSSRSDGVSGNYGPQARLPRPRPKPSTARPEKTSSSRSLGGKLSTHQTSSTGTGQKSNPVSRSSRDEGRGPGHTGRGSLHDRSQSQMTLSPAHGPDSHRPSFSTDKTSRSKTVTGPSNTSSANVSSTNPTSASKRHHESSSPSSQAGRTSSSKAPSPRGPPEDKKLRQSKQSSHSPQSSTSMREAGTDRSSPILSLRQGGPPRPATPLFSSTSKSGDSRAASRTQSSSSHARQGQADPSTGGSRHRRSEQDSKSRAGRDSEYQESGSMHSRPPGYVESRRPPVQNQYVTLPSLKSNRIWSPKEREKLRDLCFESDKQWFIGHPAITYEQLAQKLTSHFGYNPPMRYDQIMAEIHALKGSSFYRRLTSDFNPPPVGRGYGDSELCEPEYQFLTKRNLKDTEKAQDFEAECIRELLKGQKLTQQNAPIIAQELTKVALSRKWPVNITSKEVYTGKQVADILKRSKGDSSSSSRSTDQASQLQRSGHGSSSKEEPRSKTLVSRTSQEQSKSPSSIGTSSDGRSDRGSPSGKRSSPAPAAGTRAFSSSEKDKLLDLCRATDREWYVGGVDKRETYQDLANAMTAWSSKQGDDVYFYHNDIVNELWRSPSRYNRVEKELFKEGTRSGDVLTLGTCPYDPATWENRKGKWQIYEDKALDLIFQMNPTLEFTSKSVAARMIELKNSRSWPVQRDYYPSAIDRHMRSSRGAPPPLPSLPTFGSEQYVPLPHAEGTHSRREFSLAEQSELARICGEKDYQWMIGKPRATYQEIADDMNEPSTFGRLHTPGQLTRHFTAVDIAEEVRKAPLQVYNRAKIGDDGRLSEPAHYKLKANPVLGSKIWQQYELDALEYLCALAKYKASGVSLSEKMADYMNEVAQSRQWPATNSGRPPYTTALVHQKRLKEVRDRKKQR